MKMNKIYLSGPMAGLPDNNFPAFEEAAQSLRRQGYVVTSPHEIEQIDPESWEGCLKRDLREMLLCDTILLLPGWMKSRGAMLELFVARQVAMDVKIYEEFTQ